jgi:amino acid permease
VSDRRRVRGVLVALAIGWAGLVAHDLAEFGGPSPENSVPFGLAFLALAVAWSMRGGGRLLRLTTLAFGVLVAFASAVSVLPLPFWPWDPDQGVTHYAVHALAVGAQLPLIVRMARDARR